MSIYRCSVCTNPMEELDGVQICYRCKRSEYIWSFPEEMDQA